ncbi:hypothetical protein DWY68_18580 [Phocaeicola vulgatus]|jgi:hypothetical protein|nr:hypothetical protein DWY68_18580 [Phocaeicola vulgatus]
MVAQFSTGILAQFSISIYTTGQDGNQIYEKHPCRTMFGRGVFILFLKEMSILTKGSKIAWFSRADCDGFSKC